MSDSLTESSSRELIEKHRKLNKKSGAKSHLATSISKGFKLRLKDAIANRAREGCDECAEYLGSHEHTDLGGKSVFQPHPGDGLDAAFGHEGVPDEFADTDRHPSS